MRKFFGCVSDQNTRFTDGAISDNSQLQRSLVIVHFNESNVKGPFSNDAATFERILNIVQSTTTFVFVNLLVIIHRKTR